MNKPRNPDSSHGLVSGTALAAGHSPGNIDSKLPVASAKPLKAGAIALKPYRTPRLAWLSICLAVVLFSGCGKTAPDGTVPVASGEVADPTKSQPPAIVDPEAQLLAELEQARQTLETKQSERRDLLIASKTETEKLTADLKIKLSGAGLSVDDAVKLFAEPNAERGPQAELVGLYRKTARRRVHIVRLEKVITQDRGDITQLEARIDDIQQKQQLKQAISQADRDAARQVLDRARLDADERERQEIQNPEQLDELNTAFTQVRESLRKRQSLLPKRTESKLDDLPALPKLEFATTGLAEKVLLESLQESLTEGREKAEELLGKQQPEGAISLLQQTFARIRQELAAFQKAPAWKSKCEMELDEAVTALSEQLAEPYLAALEKSIPEARRQKDWGPVLSLLEELIRVAPKAKQLPTLMDELQQLLAWRVESGDIEARVAAERFNQLQEQLNRPRNDVGVNATPARFVAKPLVQGDFGQRDLKDWEVAQAELAKAGSNYRKIESERATLIGSAGFETKHPKVKAKDAEQVVARSVLEVAMRKLDAADRVVFDQLQKEIDLRQRRYVAERAIGVAEHNSELVQLRAEINLLKDQQSYLAPGHQRASGRGKKLSVDEMLLLSGAPATITDPDGMEFVVVPAGEFVVSNSETTGTQHRVKISKPFAVAKYECTRGQFEAFVRATKHVTDKERRPNAGHSPERGWEPENGSWQNPGFSQSNEHPAVFVSYNDAQAYLTWRSRKFSHQYRLPTAAEITYLNDDSDDEPANYLDESSYRILQDEGKIGYAFAAGTMLPPDDGYVFTSPVGKFAPNRFRLHDISGNATEWCLDWDGPDQFKQMLGTTIWDPKGPPSGMKRVVQGGSFESVGNYRFGTDPAYANSTIGFRVIRVIE